MKIFITLLIIFNWGFTHISYTSKFNPGKEFTFVQWNKATFSSLERQFQSEADSKVKAYYENRILALKNYLDIQDLNTENKKSIRFQFLSLIGKDINNKNILIIEATESGEKITIQNYVVYIKNSTQVDIDRYLHYPDRKWVKIDSLKNIGFSPNLKLKENFAKFAKGFNYDDIIVTHVNNRIIQDSEYFLFGTLLDNGLKSILF